MASGREQWRMGFKAVVIGASAGGLDALRRVLKVMPASFPVPIVVVQHMGPDAGDYLVRLLNGACELVVKEADEKELASPGTVYVAPSNYHLLVEREGTLSLSLEGRVCHARPSIDVLFETAADAYCPHLIGVILTGANGDGARGLGKIKKRGGLAVVQDPAEAEADAMPRAAMAAVQVDAVLPVDQIGLFLNRRVLGENVNG